MRLTVERDLRIGMRDGIPLAADLYRIDDREPRPTLLHRTPYGKREQGAGRALDALTLAEAGFNVIVQDVRGRYGSGGRFTPYVGEGDDGVDTAAWLRRQPWATGRLGMVGRSYGGLVQWQACAAGAGIDAIAPDVTSADPYDGWTYEGGVFQLGFCLHWTLADLVGDTAHGELDRLPSLYRRPWEALQFTDEAAPYYRSWVENSADGAFWEARRATGSEDVPALVITGWYDSFLRGAVRSYVAARHRGSPACSSRLVIGPWSHGVSDGMFPGHDFGPSGRAPRFDSADVQRQWFLSTLARRQGRDAARVSVFLMGADEWLEMDAWPPPTDELRLHLESSGRAGESSADGRLGEAPADNSAPDTFRFDPSRPVPTLGGATLMSGAEIGANVGPLDQRPVERRRDVLCYTGDRLTADVDVVGDVVATLYVTSSAVDTDFTAKLVDVAPTGTATIVCDGIQRLSQSRDLDTRARALSRPQPVDVDLGPTAYRYGEGHRIRLEVSSSSFPRFEPNPNTGAPSQSLAGSHGVIATNAVHHDRRRPSVLRLPRLR